MTTVACSSYALHRNAHVLRGETWVCETCSPSAACVRCGTTRPRIPDFSNLCRIDCYPQAVAEAYPAEVSP